MFLRLWEPVSQQARARSRGLARRSNEPGVQTGCSRSALVCPHFNHLSLLHPESPIKILNRWFVLDKIQRWPATQGSKERARALGRPPAPLSSSPSWCQWPPVVAPTSAVWSLHSALHSPSLQLPIHTGTSIRIPTTVTSIRVNPPPTHEEGN